MLPHEATRIHLKRSDLGRFAFKALPARVQPDFNVLATLNPQAQAFEPCQPVEPDVGSSRPSGVTVQAYHDSITREYEDQMREIEQAQRKDSRLDAS